MTKSKRSRFANLGSSFRDLIILVIGIMLSFFLTERRQNKADAKEEKRIISLLYEDLQSDTAQMHQNMAYVKQLRQNYDTIVKYKDRPEDILPIEMYSYAYQVINLVPFNPKQTAYQQFIYQERSQTIRNKEILSGVISLFNSEYARLENINSAHEDFLVNKLAAKYYKLLPAVNSAKDFDEEAGKKIMAMVQNSEVLNMLQFDVILKVNLEKSYQDAISRAEEILSLIESEYDKADWLTQNEKETQE